MSEGAKNQPQRILMIGQSGLEKSQYLNELQSILQGSGLKLTYDTIGHKMIELYNRGIDEKTILNLPRDLLEHLERQAWREILESLRDVNSDFHVINTHAVFRWDHGLIPVIDIDLLIQYKPNIIVCLIDDILNILYNLSKKGIYKFNLWELFVWREEEVWLGKFMSQFLQKLLPEVNTMYYILPKAQGVSLMAQLLTNPDLPKVYLSFPITGISEEEQREINSFKDAISSSLIAFDPFAIKDRMITFHYYSMEEEIKGDLSSVITSLTNISKNLSKDDWEIYIDEDTPLALIKFKNLDKLGLPSVDLLGREHLMTIRAIDAQIISRDYLLIDQSDFVIIYIKDEDGKPRISAGCQSELTYAYTHGKEVNVVYKGGERKLSPFVTQFSNVFTSVEECLIYIQEKYIKGGEK